MTPAHLIPSPLGDIAVRIEDDALTGLYFVGQKYFPSLAILNDAHTLATSPIARRVAEEIAEYFTGARDTFSVPIYLRGTAFQRRGRNCSRFRSANSCRMATSPNASGCR